MSMKKSVAHYENRINYLKYRDEVSNRKKQVTNCNLIKKATRQMERVAKG